MRRAAAALLLLAALASPGALSAAAPPDTPFPLSLRDPVTGDTVEVRPGARALHLVFTAAWCPPCRDELSRLQEVHAAWARRGYRLVLVAVPTRHTAERLAEFAVRQAPPGELLWDADGAAERALDVAQVPTHLLYDASGRLVARAPALDDALVKAIEGLAGARRRTR